MNRFLLNSSEIFRANELDFNQELAWHFVNGIVLSSTNFFALACFSKHDSPDDIVSLDDSDTLFVTMFAGDMKSALNPLKDKFQFIAFKRSFKNSPRTRVHPMEAFYNKLT